MSHRFRQACYRLGELVTLTLVLYACAEVIPPEGGPKDTTPPKLLQTLPQHERTNFNGKKITLVFDKRIQVQDLANKLVITPKLKKREGQSSYTYKVRGKKLILTLAVPLEEATTYTFNFNDAVRDITEGNITQDVVLTFSTGDQLDRMAIAGQISYLLTGRPAAKVLVSLYRAEDELLHILNSPPDYFGYTDEKGNFRLEHLKKGQYYICASDNKKGQLVADPSTDAYGFLRDAIDLTNEEVKAVALQIVPADIRPFKLLGQQPQDQYFEISFNKPVADYTLTWARKLKRFQGTPSLYSHLIEDKCVIQVYNTLGLLEEDSLEAHLKATDALGTVIEETVEVCFREGRAKKQNPTYQLSPPTGAAITPAFVGTMALNKPASEVKADSIYFVFNGQDTVRLGPADVQFNAQRDVVTLKKQLDPSLLLAPKEKAASKKTPIPKEDRGLILHLDEGALTTVEGDASEAMRYNYTFQNPKAYGTIKGTVLTDAPGFVVQLLDMNYKVMQEVRNQYQYQFNQLVPGDYRLRLLVLKEASSGWSCGNIHERIEPDPVVVYPQAVAVIANWEVKDIDFVYIAAMKFSF